MQLPSLASCMQGLQPVPCGARHMLGVQSPECRLLALWLKRGISFYMSVVKATAGRAKVPITCSACGAGTATRANSLVRCPQPWRRYGDLTQRKVRGVVLESFGVGNMPDLPAQGWLPWLKSNIKQGLKVARAPPLSALPAKQPLVTQ